MKIQTLVSAVALTLFGVMGVSSAAESKRTVNYILSKPESFEGKEVTLDVAAVKPVKWKSPIPELMFFHALTLDRIDDKPGGTILVAVNKADSEAFIKKYGLNVDGRNDRDTMKGVLITVRKNNLWIVDHSGKLADILKEKEIDLPKEVAGDFGGPEDRKRLRR